MQIENPIEPQNLDETYGFLSPQFYQDPYPYFRAVQQIDAVHWSNNTNSWLVTKYNDVANGLRDASFSAKRGSSHMLAFSEEVREELTPLSNFYVMWLMYMEEPDHGRVKRLINRPFAPDAVEKQISDIQDKATSLLIGVKPGNELDILSEFATPLAVNTMGNMLGLPESDHHLVLRWSHDLVGFLGAKGDVEKGRAAQKTLTELSDYLDPIVTQSPDQIESDLLSTLVAAEQSGQITKPELLGVVANVLIDGHEPIANAIANGMLALIENPDQLKLLRERRDLMQSAVEEMIRYNPSFQYAARTATEDIMVGDKKIQKGQRVQFMLGAANRDPEQFNNANSFDIQRSPNQHGSFGFGIHYCPGARIGRRTIDVAISTLLNKFSNFQLTDEKPQWVQSLGYRALASLKIKI